jgi:heterodisulfide reductase subunit C
MRLTMRNAPKDSYFMSKKESDLRAAFLEQVSLIPDGHRIKQCIQCGTCTGSCPVSYAMDITPRKMIALFRAGEVETILRSSTIWICASCYACTVRCRAGIKITDMMYAFKRIAMMRKIYPKNFPVHALSSSFVKLVNRYGRNPEVSLLANYSIRRNPLSLLAQIPLGLRLRLRGRVRIKPSSVKNRRQLSEIIRRATNFKNQKPATTH